MADTAKGFLDHGKPWRPDVRWQVVAAEAVILVVLGIYMLIDTDRAGDWILQIIGLVFTIVSLQLAISAFRSGQEGGLGVFDSFRSGIGVTIGIIATSIWWSDTVSNDAGRQILGWGLVAFAVLQLIGIVVVRGRENFRPANLVFSALTLVLGVLLLTTDSASSESRVQFLAIVLAVFGVVLGGLAWLIRSRDEEATA